MKQPAIILVVVGLAVAMIQAMAPARFCQGRACEGPACVAPDFVAGLECAIDAAEAEKESVGDFSP